MEGTDRDGGGGDTPVTEGEDSDKGILSSQDYKIYIYNVSMCFTEQI